jgi:uncharacterized protein (TIGR03067 family)
MSDQEDIQGAWALLSAERNGKHVPDDVIQHIQLIFAGDALTTKHKDRKTVASFKLDAKQTPKEIDLDMGGQCWKRYL